MRYQLVQLPVNETLSSFVLLDIVTKVCKLRDQSIYPEDGGKLVWKNAAHNDAVLNRVMTCGVVVAEAHDPKFLAAHGFA
jgi:hypothetical protein